MTGPPPTPGTYSLSTRKLIVLSVAASFGIFAVSLLVQWLVYDDWLHQTGPLHLVGTSIATVLTFAFVMRWLFALRNKQRETIARFQKISQMNDRIRNSLQAIECITYAADPSATDAVRQAVEVIDGVLKEAISDPAVLPRPLISPADIGKSEELRNKSVSA
jgi:hypothetical protein